MLPALDTSDSIALGAGVVAVLDLGVAVCSVLVARGANKLSADSNDLARRALDLENAIDIVRALVERSGRVAA